MLFKSNPIELIQMYAQGYFPTLNTKQLFLYYRPETRPMIPPQSLHTSKTTMQKIKANKFDVKFDEDFYSVIEACIRTDENWITPEIVHTYHYLFTLGIVHTVGCYENNKLVGGLYGIALGSCFFIESMFSNKTDASKVAIYYLAQKLIEQDFVFMDCQISSQHLTSLGAIEVDLAMFMQTLSNGIHSSTTWGQSFELISKKLEFNLKTERLCITKVNYNDRDAIFKLGAHEEFNKYTLVDPIKTENELNDYINKAQNLNKKGLPESLAIRLNEKYIGAVSAYMPNPELPCLEIAIEIAPEHWGKGYATEVLRKMISFISDVYPIYRLQARVVPDNKASNILFKKVGFTHEGLMKAAYWYNQIIDVNMYSITRKNLKDPLK